MLAPMTHGAKPQCQARTMNKLPFLVCIVPISNFLFSTSAVQMVYLVHFTIVRQHWDTQKWEAREFPWEKKLTRSLRKHPHREGEARASPVRQGEAGSLVLALLSAPTSYRRENLSVH
jgi:hypothetical protein